MMMNQWLLGWNISKNKPNNIDEPMELGWYNGGAIFEQTVKQHNNYPAW